MCAVTSVAVLLGVIGACAAAGNEDASGGQFDSLSTGIKLSWPKELVRSDAQDPASSAALLVLKPSHEAYPTINLIEVPGRFDLSRAAETVSDSYRAVGLTDAEVQRSTILPQGWAELELTYGGGAGVSRSRVLVIPRQESHLVLTLVDLAASKDANEALWRSVLSSIRINTSMHQGLESGQATSSPPVWVVLLVLMALAAGATALWHRRRS